MKATFNNSANVRAKSRIMYDVKNIKKKSR